MNESNEDEDLGYQPAKETFDPQELFNRLGLDPQHPHPPDRESESGSMEENLNLSREEILTITVEIGEGREENIRVLEGDTAEGLAYGFCLKYGLEEKLRDVLVTHIQKNIDAVLLEEEEEVRESKLGDDPLRSSPYDTPLSEGEVLPLPQESLPRAPYMGEEAEEIGNKNIENIENIDRAKKGSPVDPPSFQTQGYEGELNLEAGNQSLLGNQSVEEFNQWQFEIERKLRDRMKNMYNPRINENSRALMANNPRSSLPVHERLHLQALNKQKVGKRQESGSHSDSRADASLSLPHPLPLPINKETPKPLSHPYQRPQTAHDRVVKSHPGFQGPHPYRNAGEVPQFEVMPDDYSYSQGGTPTRNLNYGHRLYHKGIKKMEEKERIVREVRKSKVLQELEAVTFKPQINNPTQNRKKTCTRLEDHLITQGRITKERNEKRRSIQYLSDQQKYSFKPDINPISEKMAEERSRIMMEIGEESFSQNEIPNSKFEFLFEDAKRRQDHIERLRKIVPDTECTFKPDIGPTRSLYPQPTFMQRLAQRQKTPQKANHTQAKEKNEGIDKRTGQVLFQPQIGRAPIRQRNTASMPIGEYLYSHKQIHDQNIERKVKEINFLNQQKMKAPPNKSSSNKILEKKKKEIFEIIFRQLDSDTDGIIAPTKIDISKLNPEILEVFTPLLCELEEMEETLDLSEFLSASTRLYKSLTLPERNIILNYVKKDSRKSNIPSYSFKPKINQISLKLAEKKRPPGVNWNEACRKEKQEARQKIEELKSEKETNEMRGCTFSPQLYKPMRINEEHTYVPSQMRNPQQPTTIYQVSGTELEGENINMQHLVIDPHQIIIDHSP